MIGTHLHRQSSTGHRVLPAVLALLLLVSCPWAAGAETLSLRSVEPFSIDLPAGGALSDSAGPGFPETIHAAAAQGETTTVAVVGIHGVTEPRTITARAGSATGPGSRDLELVEVYLIRGLPRNNRYMGTLLGSRQLAALGSAYPDILLSDEPMFDRRVNTATGGRLASQLAGDRVTATLGPGEVKYLLIRVTVPPEVSPGSYRAEVTVTADTPGLDLTIPLLVEVLPFALPPHGKILRVANDFASPSAPRFEEAMMDQAAHGMTATRLTGVLKGKARDQAVGLLQKLGFTHLVLMDEPRSRTEAGRKAGDLQQYFYGVDEPQPKSRRTGRPWSRMADHVKLSARIHALGGRVTTSLPYPLATELARRDSDLYTTLADYGLPEAFEPLDWANYGLGLQSIGRSGGDREEQTRPGREPRNGGKERTQRERGSQGSAPAGKRPSSRNQELFEYISTLQDDVARGRTRDGRTPQSKHDWIECYYFPLGSFKSPFYGRLLFGFYLFNSRLDGAAAWTYFRPRGTPFTDEDGQDPVIAYPGKDGMVPTYWWEAVREGVNDLRYCTLAEDLLVELKKSHPEESRKMAARLQSILAPFMDLAPGGQRIDRVITLATFRSTRSELLDLIRELHTLERSSPGPVTPASRLNQG